MRQRVVQKLLPATLISDPFCVCVVLLPAHILTTVHYVLGFRECPIIACDFGWPLLTHTCGVECYKWPTRLRIQIRLYFLVSLEPSLVTETVEIDRTRQCCD